MTAPTTRAACLTPPGRGAIAVLGLRGPRAWDVVRSLFRPRRGHDRSEQVALPDQPRAGQFWLGHMGEGAGDEVVLSVRRTEPVPWVEVHCHGGPEVVRYLLDSFVSQGVTVCPWPEFERDTAANPIRAAAAYALAHALTARTAAVLLDQYHGALERDLTAAGRALNEDDHSGSESILADLVRRAPLGRHLTAPWRVAVVGPPNVGKSSLVNALAGFQRSIVSPTPGTTRDVVTTRVAVEGWPVELSDTAGLRDEAGDLEGQGILRARATAESADLCLWVLDASAPPAWPAPPGRTVRYVVNKTDLPAAWDLGTADAVRVSARTGDGLAELCQQLARWLVPDPPAPGTAVPFDPLLAERVESALGSVRAARYDDTRGILAGLCAART